MSLLTIVNSINRLCPGLNPDIVKSFIQDSYLQLSRKEWNMLKVIRNISTVTPYGVGTVSVTAGGVVTGAGGATFTSAMVGRCMRLYYSDALFTIATVTPPTTLTISDWSGAVLIGQVYTIYKNIFSIPYSGTPISRIGDVVYQTSLDKKSQAFFNETDPSRTSTGSPTWWADAGIDIYKQPIIEIYPLPDGIYPLRIYGRVGGVTLGDNDSPVLPEDLIEAHTLIALFRLQSTLHPKLGWEQRLVEQKETYQEILDQVQDEDYLRGAIPNKVKEATEWPFPPSDTFASSHDIE